MINAAAATTVKYVSLFLSDLTNTLHNRSGVVVMLRASEQKVQSLKLVFQNNFKI